MKRSSFLKTGLAIGSALSLPFSALSKWKNSQRNDKGFKVDAGKGRHDKSLKPFDGDEFFVKVSGRDTDGEMFIFESTREKEGGPVLHTHFAQDEWWYVISGVFLIKVGETIYNAKAGDFVFGPRNVPHTFSKVGKGDSRLIIGFQPAGKMEEMFEKLTQGAAKNMTEEQRNKFRIEHGYKNVGPAIDVLKQ